MLRARETVIAATVLWLASLAAGGFCILHYESTPDSLGASPRVRPSESSIRLVPEQFTLLLFVHPRCPCVRASLEELSGVMARSEGHVNVYVLLVKPPHAPAGWESTGLRSLAARIPGVEILTDENGREARRFGAETSGLTLLYDPQGRLCFRGGITAGRGHQGDNPGLRALVGQLRRTGQEYAENPVYGCPLFGDSSPDIEEGSECNR